MSDELEEEIKSIIQTCEGLAIPTISGQFEREKLPVVQWDNTNASGWKDFLAFAKSFGSAFIVVERYEFDEEEIEHLRPEEGEERNDDELEPGDGADTDFDFEAEWNELKRKHERFYGTKYSYVLHWVKEGICFTYDKEPEWYQKLRGEVDRLKERLESIEDEIQETEVPELSDKETEEIASSLAKDDLFQKATNQGARRYALKKRFPKILEDHAYQVTEIINQAKGIFELEIEPELEKALDAQIGDLAKDGLDKEQIAKKLKLPVSRVKRAL